MIDKDYLESLSDEDLASYINTQTEALCGADEICEYHRRAGGVVPTDYEMYYKDTRDSLNMAQAVWILRKEAEWKNGVR